MSTQDMRAYAYDVEEVPAFSRQVRTYRHAQNTGTCYCAFPDCRGEAMAGDIFCSRCRESLRTPGYRAYLKQQFVELGKRRLAENRLRCQMCSEEAPDLYRACTQGVSIGGPCLKEDTHLAAVVLGLGLKGVSGSVPTTVPAIDPERIRVVEWALLGTGFLLVLWYVGKTLW